MTKDDLKTEKWHQDNFNRVADGEKPRTYNEWWWSGKWPLVLAIIAFIAFKIWADEKKKKGL